MNIITDLKTRISKRLQETKNPCKGYTTEKACEAAISVVAQDVANHFKPWDESTAKPARYVVFYHEEFGKWVGAIDMSELLSRPNRSGGYLGFVAERNFYSF